MPTCNTTGLGVIQSENLQLCVWCLKEEPTTMERTFMNSTYGKKTKVVRVCNKCALKIVEDIAWNSKE